jgi:CelD/BcsL family acetyltransferase involved in cellulose biosynthesis
MTELALDGHAADPAWEQLRAKWLALLNGDGQGSIYQHPDVVRSMEKSGTCPVVFANQDHDELSFLAVLLRMKRRYRIVPGLPSLSLSLAKLLGNHVVGCHDEISLAPFLSMMSEVLSSGQVDQMLFEDLEVNSPLWKALANLRQTGVSVSYPCAPQPHWWIRFPKVPQDYWKKFSHKRRYNLRSSVKKLRHQVICYRSQQEVATFLEKAFHVSQKSWQTRRLGLRIENSFQERKYWESVATQGAYRSYILAQDAQPIAFMLGIQWQGTFVSEEIGYDPAHADFAPGTVLHFRVLEDLIASDTPAMVDFGFGDNVYKQVFGNHQTLSGPVLVSRRAWRPSLVIWSQRMRSKAGQVLRAGLRHSGGITTVRRLYRRR